VTDTNKFNDLGSMIVFNNYYIINLHIHVFTYSQLAYLHIYSNILLSQNFQLVSSTPQYLAFIINFKVLQQLFAMINKTCQNRTVEFVNLSLLF